MKFTSYHPPLRFLMGAGPATLHPRVSSALSRPIISHLDQGFLHVFREVQELLRYVMRTKSMITFPVQGPGSAAMELCVSNLVEPGDKVIVLNNGVYGQRLFEMATVYGANAIRIDHAWGEVLSPERLEEALKANKDTKIVCFVHGESSTGVLSDIQTLSKICQKYNALTIVDIAATLGGHPVEVDAWGLDAVYSNPQKCLSAPPGLSPVSLNDRAMNKALNRKHPVRSWCFDLKPIYENITDKQAHRFFPHTSPTYCFYALHEALLMIHEEGIENVWKRHHVNALALSGGLRALGLKHTTPDEIRIPQLNVVWTPDNTTVQEFRDYLIRNYYLEISDGMADWSGKTLRVGTMGQTSMAANVLYCVSAIGQALQHFGNHANITEALDLVRSHLSNGKSKP